MKNSRILSVFFALVFAVTLFACGGGATTEAPAEEPAATPTEEPAADTTTVEMDTVAVPVDTAAVDSTAS